MAAVGFSEFTFGFGFLYEQTRQHWTNLRAAPVLPSLAQEANDAWDAHLPTHGTDFYYQFKLSDYLTRSNSLFHRDGTYHAPYYRIALHRHHNNRQHHRLWIHAQANPHTYYVAPEFDNIDDFNNAFLARRLASRCRLIPLRQCSDYADNEQHYLTFQRGDSNWLQHSKKKSNNKSYSGAEIETLFRESQPQWRRIDQEFATAALVRTRDSIQSILRAEEYREADGSVALGSESDIVLATQSATSMLRLTAQLLAAFVGVTMVVVGSTDE